MVPLMERIAWQLCERVTQVIDVHTLFKYVWMHWNFTLEVQVVESLNLIIFCNVRIVQ